MKSVFYALNTVLFSAALFSAASLASAQSIVIHSHNQSFSPVLDSTAKPPQSQQSPQGQPLQKPLGQLHSGQLMQSTTGQATGVLTGSILVKLKEQKHQLAYKNASAILIDDKFVLLSFPEETDLWAELNTLLAMPEVEAAELEVNLKNRRAQ